MTAALIIAYVVIADLWFAYEFAWWQRTFPTLAERHHDRDFIRAFLSALIWPITAPAWIAAYREKPFSEIVEYRLWRGLKWW